MDKESLSCGNAAQPWWSCREDLERVQPIFRCISLLSRLFSKVKTSVQTQAAQT